MKKIIILLMLVSFTNFSNGQNLIEIYKTGKVDLVADKDFGAANNWETIFSGYYDKMEIQQVGDQKRIVVGSDGSVYMSHKNHHEIWKFDSQGKLSKKIGEYGGQPGQFPMLPRIQPIIGAKYLFTNDVHGRLKFFDLEGNYVKTIKLDYMANLFQPISDDKLLVSGRVLWKKGWREIISIIDIETGKEDIIFSKFRDRMNFTYIEKEGSEKGTKIMLAYPDDDIIYIPFSNYFLRPRMVFSPQGDIIVANGKTGNVKVYDSSGSLINEFKLDVTPISITEKDVQENYEKVLSENKRFVERIKNSEQFSDEQKQKYLEEHESRSKDRLTKLQDISNYYPHLPYFTNIMFDDQNNLLVFQYTRKDEGLTGKFSVIAFSSNGKKLAEASFNCEDYILKITASTFRFHNGYIYSICEEKGSSGIPLRLVRFKLQPLAE